MIFEFDHREYIFKLNSFSKGTFHDEHLWNNSLMAHAVIASCQISSRVGRAASAQSWRLPWGDILQ